MMQKRMLIVDAEVAKKIDENRGDMSYSDFINFIIDGRLEEGGKEGVKRNFVTREELAQSLQGIKELLRSFLEFFIAYGLEIDKQPKDKTIDELGRRLQALDVSGSKGTDHK